MGQFSLFSSAAASSAPRSSRSFGSSSRARATALEAEEVSGHHDRHHERREALFRTADPEQGSLQAVVGHEEHHPEQECPGVLENLKH